MTDKCPIKAVLTPEEKEFQKLVREARRELDALKHALEIEELGKRWQRGAQWAQPSELEQGGHVTDWLLQ